MNLSHLPVLVTQREEALILLQAIAEGVDERELAPFVSALTSPENEQALAIMAAASEVDAPVIIQASRGARSYANDIVLAKLIDALAELYPHIPVCMHQDHGNGPATCATAIQYGFTSVMMDGSLEEDAKTPASYEYNVDVTRRVTEMAHACGVSVEGELGVLGSLETGMGEAEDGHGFEGKLDHSALLTDPDQAVALHALHRLRDGGTTLLETLRDPRPEGHDALLLELVDGPQVHLGGVHQIVHVSSSFSSPSSLTETGFRPPY